MTRLTLCKSQLFVNETVKTTNINYQKKKRQRMSKLCESVMTMLFRLNF